jgi:hypothetical protein
MLKITDPGGSTAVGFIASSVFAGTTITVTMDYITAPPANGSSPLADNVQFAVMGEDTGPGNFAKATNALGGQLIGPTVLSGGGTTAMRDAKFATVATTPDGILWYNTTLRQLQVTESGAWVTTDVGGLESESLTLKVNGDTKAQLYRDGTDKTVLQNSVEPWADGVAATKSRIYLSDADQVLYYQTKALSTEETALAILTGLYTEDTAPGTTNFSTSGSWWFKIPVLGLLILGGQHSITAYGTITTVTYSTQHPGAPAFTAQPTLVTTMRGSTSGASLNESMETFERKLASFQCRPAHSGGHSGAFDYIAIGKYSA